MEAEQAEERSKTPGEDAGPPTQVAAARRVPAREASVHIVQSGLELLQCHHIRRRRRRCRPSHRRPRDDDSGKEDRREQGEDKLTKG